MASRRFATPQLASVSHYLHGEERIARSCSRLRLGLHGRTRLSAAARAGNVARCAFLVDHGALVRVRDGFGRSPLTEALARGHGECAAWLRGAGAEEDAVWGGVQVARWGVARGVAVSGDWVWSLASLGGGLLAVGCLSGVIRILNTVTGAATATLRGHASNVRALAVLPGGKVASGSWDGSVRVWNVETGACEAELASGEGFVGALAVLRDGLLASASGENSVRLWDVTTRACTAEL